MVTPTCLKCRREIPAEDINVAGDLAYCRPCNLSYQLSTLTHGTEVDSGIDVLRPPSGAWHRKDGMDLLMGATHRSLGAAVGLLFFALFWNGIVSVFVLVTLAATLSHLDIGVPHWFPAPKMNGGDMGVGMTIFLWIFLTPFIAIGMAMAGAFLSSLAGRTEIRLGGGQGVIFTGIGPLGYRRAFQVANVKAVRLEDKRWRDSDGHSQKNAHILIELKDGKPLKFGSMLSEERRRFLAGAARRALKV